MRFYFDVPDEHADMVLDAFTEVYAYQDTVDGEPNPETPVQFVKRHLVAHIKDTIARAETLKAQRVVSEMEIL